MGRGEGATIALAGGEVGHRLAAAPSRWRPVVRNARVLFGGTVLVVMVLLAVAAPVLAPFAANAQQPSIGNEPPFYTDPEGALHLFGTDPLGRDILSRILFGARVS